jgi:hypothetical protein
VEPLTLTLNSLRDTDVYVSHLEMAAQVSILPQNKGTQGKNGNEAR